jgi:hypothetical protein
VAVATRIGESAAANETIDALSRFGAAGHF